MSKWKKVEDSPTRTTYIIEVGRSISIEVIVLDTPNTYKTYITQDDTNVLHSSGIYTASSIEQALFRGILDMKKFLMELLGNVSEIRLEVEDE